MFKLLNQEQCLKRDQGEPERQNANTEAYLEFVLTVQCHCDYQSLIKVHISVGIVSELLESSHLLFFSEVDHGLKKSACKIMYLLFIKMYYYV